MYSILQKPQNSSWNVLLSNPCFILCERAIKRSFSATNQCEYNIILTLQRPRLQFSYHSNNSGGLESVKDKISNSFPHDERLNL